MAKPIVAARAIMPLYIDCDIRVFLAAYSNE
jgi:hypothetical protein